MSTSTTCPVCDHRVRVSKGRLIKHRTGVGVRGPVCPQSGSEALERVGDAS